MSEIPATPPADTQDRQGQLFIISAPSGAGKTTLVRQLTESVRDICISVSHTTRPQRQGETDGVDYFFIDDEQFNAMVDENRFLEHAHVFDHHYGTSQAAVEQQLAAGLDVILEIDWQGAQQVRARIPNNISIFIAPPSYDSLAERLYNRGREDTATISRRLDEAVDELSHYQEYDYLVVNDQLERALSQMLTIVVAARLRVECRRPALDGFIQGLIAQARQIQ